MAANPDSLEEQIEREPSDSAPWLALLDLSEQAGRDYQDRCDKIDRLYADLEHFRDQSRDREFNLFWSNMEVVKPATYARPPIPVVVPEFKDRRPLYRTSSEMLERCVTVAFKRTNLDEVMQHVRDDLVLKARGVSWVRYESKKGQKICVEHLVRSDFRCDPARKWSDVAWVARCAWMTLDEMVERFDGVERSVLTGADFRTKSDKDDWEDRSAEEKAPVWELWHKGLEKVVWVAEGVPEVLDEGAPHLDVEGFFPCPKPAYGTLRPDTLDPVADVQFYLDQLNQINDLTARIHALSGALQVRGFYPSGAGELGDAIESALAQTTDDKVLIGISNWAAFGGGAAKDSIVWLPIDQVASTIMSCVELRRQIIEDVYQLAGISDIQRAETDPNETLGAQEIKQENGSARVKEKQRELSRVARDLVRISADIIAEKFTKETLLDMSQMEIPTNAEVSKEVRDLKAQADAIEQGLAKQIEQANADPRIQQMVQQDPQKAQEVIAQATQQAEMQANELRMRAAKAEEQPTIEKIIKFFRDNRIRPFVLDIETDSTIISDENAEKARRGEFLTALGSLMQQLAPLLQATPESAPFAAEVLKFGLQPFRVGRQMDSAIDEFAEQMMAKAGQPQQGGDDQAALLEAQNKIAEAEIQKAKAATMAVEARAASETQKLQAKMFEMQQKAANDQQKSQLEVGTLQGKLAEQDAKINLMQAQTAEILSKIGLDVRKQDLEEYKAAEQSQMNAINVSQDAERTAFDQQQQIEGNMRADRGEDRQDRSQEFSERMTEQSNDAP